MINFPGIEPHPRSLILMCILPVFWCIRLLHSLYPHSQYYLKKQTKKKHLGHGVFWSLEMFKRSKKKKVETDCHPRNFVYSINIHWQQQSQRWFKSHWQVNKLKWSGNQMVGNLIQINFCQNNSFNFSNVLDAWVRCTQLGYYCVFVFYRQCFVLCSTWF